MILNLEECDCKYCDRIQKIKRELDRRGFDTFNKNVDCWRVTDGAFSEVVVTPELDEDETVC